MKSHRKSNSTEIRNAHKTMAARGRASLSRDALFDHDRILTGRAFRRANKLSRAEAELIDVQTQGRAIGRPKVIVATDDYGREIKGWPLT